MWDKGSTKVKKRSETKESILENSSTQSIAFSIPLDKSLSSRSFLFPNHKKDFVSNPRVEELK